MFGIYLYFVNKHCSVERYWDFNDLNREAFWKHCCLDFLFKFISSSANAFNLDQSKILSFGKELIVLVKVGKYLEYARKREMWTKIRLHLSSQGKYFLLNIQQGNLQVYIYPHDRNHQMCRLPTCFFFVYLGGEGMLCIVLCFSHVCYMFVYEIAFFFCKCLNQYRQFCTLFFN